MDDLRFCPETSDGDPEDTLDLSLSRLALSSVVMGCISEVAIGRLDFLGKISSATEKPLKDSVYSSSPQIPESSSSRDYSGALNDLIAELDDPCSDLKLIQPHEIHEITVPLFLDSSENPVDPYQILSSRLKNIELHTFLGNSDAPGEPANEEKIEYSEKALKQNFASLVNELKIRELVVVEPGKDVPRKLDDYRIIPLVATTRFFTSSSDPAAYSYQAPDGVRFNYRGEGGAPYLDTSFAIGLVYKDTLSAIASARINPQGNLRIVQLQGVNDVSREAGKGRFKDGLHGGFLWRDTLARAWARAAKQLEIDMLEIQGGLKNEWLNSSNKDLMLAGYDQVAERMGFTFNSDNGCWGLMVNNTNKQQEPVTATALT